MTVIASNVVASSDTRIDPSASSQRMLRHQGTRMLLLQGNPGSPNRHQPKNKLISVRRGERGWAGRGGPLWAPASSSFGSPVREKDYPPHPAGDRKGPPNPTSSALAPTDHPAPCLTSRLRLMPIGRPLRTPSEHPPPTIMSHRAMQVRRLT